MPKLRPRLDALVVETPKMQEAFAFFMQGKTITDIADIVGADRKTVGHWRKVCRWDVKLIQLQEATQGVVLGASGCPSPLLMAAERMVDCARGQKNAIKALEAARQEAIRSNQPKDWEFVDRLEKMRDRNADAYFNQCKLIGLNPKVEFKK